MKLAWLTHISIWQKAGIIFDHPDHWQRLLNVLSHHVDCHCFFFTLSYTGQTGCRVLISYVKHSITVCTLNQCLLQIVRTRSCKMGLFLKSALPFVELLKLKAYIQKLNITACFLNYQCGLLHWYSKNDIAVVNFIHAFCFQ